MSLAIVRRGPTMLIKTILSCLALSVLASMEVVAADAPAASAQLTADQVVAKNIAAKGGLQAWRAVQSMSFSGKVDAGGKQNVQLPFVIEMKRPRKKRVEIGVTTHNAIHTHDAPNP